MGADGEESGGLSREGVAAFQEQQSRRTEFGKRLGFSLQLGGRSGRRHILFGWQGTERPNEQSLVPLGDWRSQIENPTDEGIGLRDCYIATHEACGHHPYRDWSRACVGGIGRSDAHKRQREEQKQFAPGEHGLWVLH